jgi:hypothetical protein
MRKSELKHEKKMYKFLKLGAGGDDQSHVSTPKSVKEKSSNGGTP